MVSSLDDFSADFGFTGQSVTSGIASYVVSSLVYGVDVVSCRKSFCFIVWSVTLVILWARGGIHLDLGFPENPSGQEHCILWFSTEHFEDSPQPALHGS